MTKHANLNRDPASPSHHQGPIFPGSRDMLPVRSMCIRSPLRMSVTAVCARIDDCIFLIDDQNGACLNQACLQGNGHSWDGGGGGGGE